MRKRTLFKIGDEIIIDIERELNYFEIEEIKSGLVKEIGCKDTEIEVKIMECDRHEYSRIDIGIYGMVYWDCLYPKILTGVSLIIDEDSEEFLEMVLKNGIEEYLVIS